MNGQEARDNARNDTREALAGIVFARFRMQPWDTVPDHLRDPWRQIADAILAAGYRKHPEPEMEYEVTYSSANAPSVDGYALRRTSGVMTDLGKAREFAAAARNPLLRARTKGVPAGPWVPVGEGEQS